jgi:hypothetical protein
MFRHSVRVALFGLCGIVASSSYVLADACGGCGTVCTLRAPITGHCITHGHDVTCEAKKAYCTSHIDDVMKCAAAVLGVAGVSTSCGACLVNGGTVACAAPCAATPGAVQSAGQKCH